MNLMNDGLLSRDSATSRKVHPAMKYSRVKLRNAKNSTTKVCSPMPLVPPATDSSAGGLRSPGCTNDSSQRCFDLAKWERTVLCSCIAVRQSSVQCEAWSDGCALFFDA